MKALMRRIRRCGVLPVKESQAEKDEVEFSSGKRTVHVSLSFPEDFYQHVLCQAHQHDVSMSKLVRAALRLSLPVFESNPAIMKSLEQKCTKTMRK